MQSICSYSQIEASSLKCLSQCSWPKWLLLIVWRGGGYRVEMMHAGKRSGGRSITNSWSLFRLLRFPNSDQTQTLAHTWQPTTDNTNRTTTTSPQLISLKNSVNFKDVMKPSFHHESQVSDNGSTFLRSGLFKRALPFCGGGGLNAGLQHFFVLVQIGNFLL